MRKFCCNKYTQDKNMIRRALFNNSSKFVAHKASSPAFINQQQFRFYSAAENNNKYENLTYEKKENGVALITLYRPKALNALNKALCQELGQLIQAIEKDSSVRVTVLTGSEKAFAAGADIKEMSTMSYMDTYKNNLFGDLDVIPLAKKPIIAAVNGYALGGGCELAMMCDFIIAGDNAKFGQPEIKLGTIPGIGGTQRLTKAIGKAKAMEWTLTGGMYSAQDAEKAGLVSRVVPAADLVKTALELAGTIASYSSPIAQFAKHCVNKSYETTLTEGLNLEKKLFQSTFATDDQKEGMSAFAEKRTPNFTDK
jgi:enoyl-CoA hydratase